LQQSSDKTKQQYIFAIKIFKAMEHTVGHDNHHRKPESLWETYIGKGGSSAFVFLYLAVAFFLIYAFINWG
jgi:hypothetical protein